MKFTLGAAAAVLAFTAGVSAAPAKAKTRQSTVKRGISYNDASVTSLFPTSKVSWAYNWASSPGGTVAKGLEYVPMLYNGNDADWVANVNSAIASGSTHVLGFNEPDQPTSVGGTDLDANAAAQTYISMVTNNFAGKVKLGAPAVSAGGLSWLQTFADACAGKCKIDFVPLHFYDYGHPDVGTQFDSLKGWLDSAIPQVRNMFNDQSLEVWVTEFAATPFSDMAGSSSYMGQALPFLEDNADVARYAYFMAGEGELVSNGALSSDGQTYIG